MNNKTKYRTTFLLPKNNFWVGFGSVLNIAGSYFDYNYSNSDVDADKKALFSDWFMVGEDFKKSKEKFEKDNNKIISVK